MISTSFRPVVLSQSKKGRFCWMELSARESLTCALPRVRERTYQLRRHRHDFLGGTMTKRNRAFFEEGTLEAMARLREQDDGFCQKLPIAVEMGMESCPTTVSTEPCTKRPTSNSTRPN